MVADEVFTVMTVSIMMSVIVSIMSMMVAMPVKVSQNKEPWEPEVPPPERIRNPRVQICVVRRRCIICDNRRPLIIIIIVGDIRFRIGRRRCIACSYV